MKSRHLFFEESFLPKYFPLLSSAQYPFANPSFCYILLPFVLGFHLREMLSEKFKTTSLNATHELRFKILLQVVFAQL